MSRNLSRLLAPCVQCPHDRGDHGGDRLTGGLCAECDCRRFTPEVTPCLVCGAPILDGIGHDAGCMVDSLRENGVDVTRAGTTQ